jgi:hypothetical protein
MPDSDVTDERRRPRQTTFGSLNAGMIVRGSVPESVLYGTGAPTRPPSSLREVNANVAATLAQRPASEPAPITALKPAAAATVPPIVPGGARKPVTVRLDPVHHMRLRLVGSFMRRSTQDILVAALNAYLDKLPASVPGGGSAFPPDAD